jgi:hypothetical protein
MPEEIKFEKEFSAGTTYRAESDKYYIVKAVGTDSTSEPSYLEIDGKRCLEIYSKIAPLKSTSSNLLGMFELGDLYLVIPPNKAFTFYGSSGSKIRMKGILGTLAPGEVLPGTYQSRFSVQHIKYYTFLHNKYTFGDNASVSAGTKKTVVDWTCPVGEKYIFDRYLGVEAWVNDESAAGDLSFEIFIEGVPKDVIETTMGAKGFAAGSAPYPPRDAVNKVAFDPKDLGLKFEPGRSLRIDATNASDLSAPGTGKAWEYHVVLVGTKELLTI